MSPNEFNLDEESVICKSPDGQFEVRTPAFPGSCDYIRVVFHEPALGRKKAKVFECVYWNQDEIQEDEDACAFGAAMGAIKAVFEGTYRPT